MSSNLLTGKTVVITGSATGIGRSTALGEYTTFSCHTATWTDFLVRSAVVQNGANVVLHHLGAPTSKEMAEVVDEIKKLGGRCAEVEGDISEQDTANLVRLRPTPIT